MEVDSEKKKDMFRRGVKSLQADSSREQRDEGNEDV